MNDAVPAILSAIDDVRARIEAGEAERNKARAETAQHRANVEGRLARVEQKLDFTNGKVRDGAELDKVHAASIAVLTSDVHELKQDRDQTRRRVALYIGRPTLWALTVAGSAAITLTVTRLL